MSAYFNTEALNLLASWETELVQRNTKGAYTAILLVLILYPLFGLLDYLVAPSEALIYLASSRVIVFLASLFMLKFIKTQSFQDHNEKLSAAYMFLVATGITFMILFMGGLSSHYYVGLSLVMLGCSLLFTWSKAVVIITHCSIFFSWFLANLILISVSDLAMAISNTFFLFGTTVIIVIGQMFNYKRARNQYLTRLDLTQTQAELYQAHKDLKKVDAFKSRFFANITHELKTPLALILSSTEFLLRDEFGALTEVQRSPILQVQHQGVKLLKLINDLLDLTKLEESSLKLKVAFIDIAEWSQCLLNEVKPLAERKGIEVLFDQQLDEPFIYFDPECLERVLVNLISNATKFTETGGRITMLLSGDETQIRLSIIDTGRGFTSEQAQSLFDRFYQTDMGSDRKYGGTGVGLSLSKELVELHGGDIQAFGELGQGATFTITLQRGTEHFESARVRILETEEFKKQVNFTTNIQEPGQTIQQLPQAIQNPADITKMITLNAEKKMRFVEIEDASDRRIVERDFDEDERKQTVLIAEDNPDITRLLHIGLRRHFKVVAAANGVKALELVERFQPTLVITDLMMPEMDGMELTRQLRSNPSYMNIPILMLSARDGIEAEMKTKGYPANAYMAKPFSTRSLCKLAKSLAK